MGDNLEIVQTLIEIAGRNSAFFLGALLVLGPILWVGSITTLRWLVRVELNLRSGRKFARYRSMSRPASRRRASTSDLSRRDRSGDRVGGRI